MTEMSWQVNEEVSRDMTGEADGMRLILPSYCTLLRFVNFSLKIIWWFQRRVVMHICDFHFSMRKWFWATNGDSKFYENPIKFLQLVIEKQTNNSFFCTTACIQFHVGRPTLTQKTSVVKKVFRSPCSLTCRPTLYSFKTLAPRRSCSRLKNVIECNVQHTRVAKPSIGPIYVSINTLAISVSLLLQLHSAHSYSHRRQHRDHALCSSQKRTILLPIVTNEYLYCVVFHLDSWWSPSRSCTYCLSLVTTDIISSNLILQNVTRIVSISQHERPTQYKLGDGHLSVVDTFTWCYHFLWPLLAPACPQYFFQRNTCFELCSCFKTNAVSDRDGRCLGLGTYCLRPIPAATANMPMYSQYFEISHFGHCPTSRTTLIYGQYLLPFSSYSISNSQCTQMSAQGHAT